MSGEPVVQCESCGGECPESEMRFEDVPGATLAFCPDCAKPSRREELGIRV